MTWQNGRALCDGRAVGQGFDGIWWIYFFRFVLLLSSIIPISMRVNLDLGKMLYSLLV